MFAAPSDLQKNDTTKANGQSIMLTAMFKFEVKNGEVIIEQKGPDSKVEPPKILNSRPRSANLQNSATLLKSLKPINFKSPSVSKAASSITSKIAQQNGKVVKGKTQSKTVNEGTLKSSFQKKKVDTKSQPKSVSVNASSRASKASQQNAKVVKKNSSSKAVNEGILKSSQQKKKQELKKPSVNKSAPTKASKGSQQQQKKDDPKKQSKSVSGNASSKTTKAPQQNGKDSKTNASSKNVTKGTQESPKQKKGADTKQKSKPVSEKASSNNSNTSEGKKEATKQPEVKKENPPAKKLSTFNF